MTTIITQVTKRSPVRVVFTEGGKGGVGKTAVAVCLATWYRRQGVHPKLIDFGAEDNPKGCLRGFFPDAVRIDTRSPGALDHFFEVLDSTDGVVLADMSAGAGEQMREWFARTRRDAREMNICFTAVAVTTNDPGAISSVLESARRLGDRVDYLVVLNEMRSPKCNFRYWHGNPAVEELLRTRRTTVARMRSRLEGFQAEVRNHALTLESIISRRVDIKYFRYLRSIARARRYLRQIYGEFGKASGILLPPSVTPKDISV